LCTGSLVELEYTLIFHPLMLVTYSCTGTLMLLYLLKFNAIIQPMNWTYIARP